MYAFKGLPVKDTTNPTEGGVLILTSSNIAEDAAAEWNSATSYVTGNVVRVTSANGIAVHKKYEALRNNVNKSPLDAANIGTDWLELGATNRWRAFDGVVQAKTVAESASGIVYDFTANATFDSIALFGLATGEVNLAVRPIGGGAWDDNEPTNDSAYIPPIDVYNQTFTMLDTAQLYDWYQYFFAPTTTSDRYLITGIPAYSGATVTLSLTGAAQSSVGEIVMGRMQHIGMTAWGGKISTLDFSRVEENVFGDVTILRRSSAKRVEFPVMFESADGARIDRLLDEYRSRPAVFSATQCADPYGFFVYGFYQTYDINVSGPALSYATIEVRTLL